MTVQNTTTILPTHQAIYDSIPDGLRSHFYIHKMWSGVSCIRLVKGGYKSLIDMGSQVMQTTSHALILSSAELEILKAADRTDSKVWVCSRRQNNGYVGVFVFLGTSNYEKFIEESKKRATQGEGEEVTHA